MSFLERQKNLVHAARQQIAECRQAANSIEGEFHREEQQAELDCQTTLNDVQSRCQQQLAAAQSELDRSAERVRAQIHARMESLEHETQTRIEAKSEEINAAHKRAQQGLDEARWLAHTVYDADRRGLKQQFEGVQLKLQARAEAALSVERSTANYLTWCGFPGLLQAEAVPEDDVAAGEQAVERLNQAVTDAETSLQELQALSLPRAMRRVWWIYGVAFLVAGPISFWLCGWRPAPGLVLTAALTPALAAPLAFWGRFQAQRQAGEVARRVSLAARAAQRLSQACAAQAAAVYERRRLELRRKRDGEYARAAATFNPALAICEQRRELELPSIQREADRQLVELDRELAEALRELSERHGREAEDTTQLRRAGVAAAEARRQERLAANRSRHHQLATACQVRWESCVRWIRSELTGIQSLARRESPPWDDLLAESTPTPQRLPQAICLGQFQAGEIAAAPGGPNDDLPARTTSLTLPALIEFPGETSLLVKSGHRGRGAAIELLQTVMLRLLTSLPPGKVRFTIIDAVGLGESFAGFMHLADYDEALVGRRIWTEAPHIEQRLLELTEHIETVIQKYLRDEFATIRDFNETAGEIAEPFRVLVAADFPSGFSEAALRRLLSIAASGPRCGVHLLLGVDERAQLPPGMRLADFERHATVFAAGEGRVVWQDPEARNWPLTIDVPPLDRCRRLWESIGAAAAAAKRVEVPFEVIAPSADQYWTQDSRHGIDVPLGRAGAVRLQHLRLGHGTQQHVLIAGKTGSGKSTLLHALITNAALRYSPVELEMYLIDFKKGVEFRTYVSHGLPHARVVAIESEREFGLSVMQRLDTEMRVRGERFREAGVQDLAGFRQAVGPLPRILFIVDEFQEFFSQDDRLAQEATLLLDRLVRQGRAFGIHVHLGSQTLAGAYTLPRSTLGQMAVRIALQCSDADAHLILSDDNSAARLLARPGEAIYNDANGLVEGNHPFQVVWLDDARREFYLEQIAGLAQRRELVRLPRPIVFEGSRPAALEDSDALDQALTQRVEPAAGAGAWLGEPLAIDQTTCCRFPRRGAANLLILGQNEPAATGLMLASLATLAAQLAQGSPEPPESPFTVLLGSPGTEGGRDGWRQIEAELPRLVRVADPPDVAEIVESLAVEVGRRQTGEAGDTPRFLFIYNLARFRELRREENDFGFSRGGSSPPSTHRRFVEILRDGPSVGVHTIVWCDSLTSFTRMLDRAQLREFETRVLLQMSASDSGMLLDGQAASLLGRHRALLHQEDEGRLEKFRPFAPPTAEWLHLAAEAIKGSGAYIGQPGGKYLEHGSEWYK